MSQPNSAEITGKSPSDSALKVTDNNQPAIDAEIVSPDQTLTPDNLSSTHEDFLLATETLTLDEDALSLSWLEKLLSPWAIASLSLLLLSNIVLSWIQLASLNRAEVLPTLTTTQTDKFALADSLNLAKNETHSLSIDALSTLPPVAITQPIVQTPTVTVPKPNRTLPQTTSNLTDALLPPSLQPHFTSNTLFVPTPPPKTLSAPSTPNIVQSPQVSPSIKPITITPPPPPPTQPEVSTEDRLRQTMRQQLQMEQENTPPLGFNQRTRLEMQTRTNQIDPALLPGQIQQLQQLQQQYQNGQEQIR